MKDKGKKLVVIFTLLLMVPLLWLQGKAQAYAATPAFKEKEIEIVGADGTHQLEILNKAAKSKYKWSSQDSKVVRVSSKGLVTAVGKGSTTVKCKITYSNKKTKTLTCKVTVKIPAMGIKINNAKDVNGSHTLLVGEKYDFNADLVPSNSSDSIYWIIGKGDKDCIRLDDSVNGTVTGLKAGSVTLIAKAVKTATAEEAGKSTIYDSIIIEVKEPKAAVQSAEITDSNEIKVVFDSQIDKSTVIGADSQLLDSVQITLGHDAKNVLAKDPGKYSANLSSDLKTLTITSTDVFSGVYGIILTNKIKTTGGIAINEAYKQMTFIDMMPPIILDSVVDDTGLVDTIKFSEAIDFTKLEVTNATQLTTGTSNTAADRSTLAILNNKSNYIISEDKKSITINLSKIAYADLGKSFSITISGIKDMAGNYPPNYTLPTIVRTDMSKKPQARILYIVRSGYYTLTATFDRAIQTPGWANINNGSVLNGTVDANDPKKVNYTLSETDALLNGQQTINVGFWSSYNVDPTDLIAQRYNPYSVVFVVDKTSPVLIKNEFDSKTSTLTLTYNEEVSLVSNTGIFTSKLYIGTDDRRPGNNITYSKLDSADKKIIKLKLGNMTSVGTYTFTIDQGFVTDNFKNYCMSREISINNGAGTSGELPPPSSITQSSANLSQINIEFANKLDIASAENKANYIIPGLTITKAEVTKNTQDIGATVTLTIGDDSIEATLVRPITISRVKGCNGSFGEMAAYSSTILLKDNKRPYLVGSPVYDSTAKNAIRLNFNEPIRGTISVKVTHNQTTAGATYPIEYPNTTNVSGNSVIITLSNIPNSNTYLFINILDNKIADENGNLAQTLPSQLGVVVNY